MTYIKNNIELVPKPTHGLFKDLEGRVFTRLTVIGYLGQRRQRSHWLCQCECGNQSAVSATHLIMQHTRSCGCLHQESVKTMHITHGLAHTSTYDIWRGILTRCNNPNNHTYERYGGRGIRVCNSWMKFTNFLEDMGERPTGLSIDRINNNGHYSCGHCDECTENGWVTNGRWATTSEQANNTSRTHYITYQGKTQSLKFWAKELHINYGTLRNRIYQGWDIALALTSPLHTKGFAKTRQILVSIPLD